jgi:transcriptional regulator with XRE-family HTH domain
MKNVNNIRGLRERERFTLKALASEIDVNISTLNRMENGKITQFKPHFLVNLSKLLSYTIDELFKVQANKEDLPLTKEQLYKELIATKDRRIKDLERQLKSEK